MKIETRIRPTFQVNTSWVELVELNPEPFCDLPPHHSILSLNGHSYFSPTFILRTLAFAFQQADFTIDQPPKVLSLGTGGNTYEEVNAMSYLTTGNVQEYLGIEIDPCRAHYDTQSLENLPYAKSVTGDVRELEKMISGQWDIALVRNPEIAVNGKGHTTWGMATAKLKPYLTDNSLLVMTTMSAQEMHDAFRVLKKNDYQNIKVIKNPAPGPVVGIHKTQRMTYCSDNHIITARK
jgi:hypothetical protein